VDAIFAAIGASDPGCAAGAVQDGKRLFARGYGGADLEHDAPVTPATPFMLASLTKQFTAFTALSLEKDGALNLNDPIRKYVPELGAYADHFTLRQLLQHTSGVRDYIALRELAGTGDAPFSDNDFLTLMAAQTGGDFATIPMVR
jgi:CubicO group peptidase (beta-lactamase class C family)